MSLFLRDQEMREEGEEKKMRVIVMNMLKENEPIDKICRYTECDEAFVKEIETQLKTEEDLK